MMCSVLSARIAAFLAGVEGVFGKVGDDPFQLAQHLLGHLDQAGELLH